MEAKNPAVINNLDEPEETNRGDKPFPADKHWKNIRNLYTKHVTASRVNSITLKYPDN